MEKVNLCDFCSKAKKCEKLKSVAKDISRIADCYATKNSMKIDFIMKKCRDFKAKSKIEKEVEHICFTCKNSSGCKLWKQVYNINEDFIKDAFDYDPEMQSVSSIVSYCRKYYPKQI